MGIQEQEDRARQRIIQKQAQAIAQQSQGKPRVGTIGSFQPNGKYTVNLPDGGQGQGVKIYNSLHDVGDSVLLTDRGDGNYLLDGQKAPPPRKELNIDSLDNRCKGYLNGQIFHCESEAQETVIVWAIGISGTVYTLYNLISGENYSLVGPPATIPPCAPLPPNFPPAEPPSPPLPPDAPWYRHIWNLTQGWPTPPGPKCDSFPPVPPTNTGGAGGFTNTLRTSNGRIWDYRTETYNSPTGILGSYSLTTYSQSATPPVIPTGVLSFAVIATGLVGSGWSGSYLQINGNGTPEPWVYVSGGCATVGSYTPAPPVDSRDPGGTPIPNTIEATISIGADLGPIALIRHTPNCVSPNVWNYEKSSRVQNAALVTSNGRLLTDWRYTAPAIPCQSTFKPELFTNLDFIGTALWSIEPADRPATMTQGTPIQLKITKKSIAANCSTAVVSTKTVTAQVTGNLPVTIVAIAVKIIKR
jgi:hypothetical protein